MKNVISKRSEKSYTSHYRSHKISPRTSFEMTEVLKIWFKYVFVIKAGNVFNSFFGSIN